VGQKGIIINRKAPMLVVCHRVEEHRRLDAIKRVCSHWGIDLSGVFYEENAKRNQDNLITRKLSPNENELIKIQKWIDLIISEKQSQGSFREHSETDRDLPEGFIVLRYASKGNRVMLSTCLYAGEHDCIEVLLCQEAPLCSRS